VEQSPRQGSDETYRLINRLPITRQQRDVVIHLMNHHAQLRISSGDRVALHNSAFRCSISSGTWGEECPLALKFADSCRRHNRCNTLANTVSFDAPVDLLTRYTPRPTRHTVDGHFEPENCQLNPERTWIFKPVEPQPKTEYVTGNPSYSFPSYWARLTAVKIDRVGLATDSESRGVPEAPRAPALSPPLFAGAIKPPAGPNSIVPAVHKRIDSGVTRIAGAICSRLVIAQLF
jgi:hypothetical protein